MKCTLSHSRSVIHLDLYISSNSNESMNAAINYRFIVCCLNTAQHVSAIFMPVIRSGSSAVGRGRAGRSARPRPTALLPLRSYGKPEAAAAVDRLLMMGIKMP
jgi:hypothetical protein